MLITQDLMKLLAKQLKPNLAYMLKQKSPIMGLFYWAKLQELLVEHLST